MEQKQKNSQNNYDEGVTSKTNIRDRNRNEETKSKADLKGIAIYNIKKWR